MNTMCFHITVARKTPISSFLVDGQSQQLEVTRDPLEHCAKHGQHRVNHAFAVEHCKGERNHGRKQEPHDCPSGDTREIANTTRALHGVVGDGLWAGTCQLNQSKKHPATATMSSIGATTPCSMSKTPRSMR